ncbi:MAG: hypothetical protein LAO79_22600 [Acidobacteriia bacterium]|nr:hypothetical protein [Terriglobia bacterium]
MAAVVASAQSVQRRVDLPADSPVTLVTVDWGDTGATPRGGAFFVDVHAALSLRNSSQKRVRAITMAVLSQEVTPGGKGSVSVPSLDVAPGDTFPLTIDLRLLRPIGTSAPVEVKLDGVLFDDLNFYGPDRLHSRRTLTVWELEARRDRQYFKKVLETAGRDALQKEMLDSLARQADRPQQGVQMVRGRATTTDPERELAFAFLQMPDSPVEAVSGMARVSGNEAHAPRIEVHNRSGRPVRHVEMGWLVKDQQGREFQAASMPADVSLAPGRSAQVMEDAAMRLPGASIQSMTGFVSSVEFADGQFWIPSRVALTDPKLRKAVAPSPEEQRLTQIYLKKGPAGLIEELKKF